MNRTISVKQGSLIVFEGLDKTGKSTQLERLKKIAWAEPAPHFAHLPSGDSSLSTAIYRLLEVTEPHSQLARQLLHLACHAENTEALAKQRRQSAVILDRFWWSTVAYGWHGATIGKTGLEWASLMNLVDSIWRDLTPDVVFLFLNVHEADRNNGGPVEHGYRELASEFAAKTVLVPLLAVEETSDFIVAELLQRRLACLGCL